jgi:hypothetical protein
MAVDINGDGLIGLGGTSTTQGRLRLFEDTDNGTNYVEITAPAAITSNRTLTLPDNTGTIVTSASSITASQLPAGSVLQMVTNYPTSGAGYSQSTSSFAEISADYRTAITPISSSSRLILEWTGLVGGANSGNISTMKFYDVTNNAEVGLAGISSGDRTIGHGSFRQVNTDVNDRDNLTLYAVVPSSNTNSRTYSLYHFSENAFTKYFNQTSTDNSGCSYVKWHFTITEVA